MSDPNNGTPLRLYVDGDAITDLSNLAITPRETTNKESTGWKDYIKGLKSTKIDFSKMQPIGAPQNIEQEVDYYYRRGNKYFFKLASGNKISIETSDPIQKIKRGRYTAKFTLM